MTRRSRVRSRHIALHTEALLVRRVLIGDADMMVSLFTEARGLLSAMARSARRSSKRFPALEPIHRLRVGMDEGGGGEVLSLAESELAQPRMGVMASLERFEAAEQGLLWVRRIAPPGTPEPALWVEINGLLDALDAPAIEGSPRALLAGSGLRMLRAVGWGLDFERCIRCGRSCEPGLPAYFDAGQGGLVCRACGGARTLLAASRREHLAAAIRGDDGALSDGDVAFAISIVEEALSAHGAPR